MANKKKNNTTNQNIKVIGKVKVDKKTITITEEKDASGNIVKHITKK